MNHERFLLFIEHVIHFTDVPATTGYSCNDIETVRSLEYSAIGDLNQLIVPANLSGVYLRGAHVTSLFVVVTLPC
jgi:hypothetical protein